MLPNSHGVFKAYAQTALGCRNNIQRQFFGKIVSTIIGDLCSLETTPVFASSPQTSAALTGETLYICITGENAGQSV